MSLPDITAHLSPEAMARLVAKQEQDLLARAARAEGGRGDRPSREQKYQRAARALAQAARALRAVSDEPYALAVAGAVDRVAADARRASRGKEPRDVRVRGLRRLGRRRRPEPEGQRFLPFPDVA